MVGIDSTLAFIEALGDFAVSGFGVLKGGFSPGNLRKIYEMAMSIKHLVQHAPGALREWHDLDSQESDRLGEASYKQISRVFDAIKL